MTGDVLRVDVQEPAGRLLRWIALSWAVLMATSIVFLLLADDVSVWQWLGPVSNVFVGGMVFSTRFRPQIAVVDARGYKVPWELRVPWSKVASVLPPGQFDSVVELRLVSGRIRRTRLPKEHAAQVAQIGGLPLGRASGSSTA